LWLRGGGFPYCLVCSRAAIECTSGGGAKVGRGCTAEWYAVGGRVRLALGVGAWSTRNPGNNRLLLQAVGWPPSAGRLRRIMSYE